MRFVVPILLFHNVLGSLTKGQDMNIAGKIPTLPCAVAALLCLAAGAAFPLEFQFTNITDRTGGTSSGWGPSINLYGDIAYTFDDSVHVYSSAEGDFRNIQTLPGAPARGWHPRINDVGNVAFIDADRHVWLYEADGEVLTDLAEVTGFPGVSGLHSLYGAFDLNNSNRIALHSGSLNYGDIYVYDHATGLFTRVTDQPGGSWRGTDCRINDANQVAYSGYPDTYIMDLMTGITENITDLPGGPGTGLPSAILNNEGDIAISSGSELVRYTAATATFWYLSTLPGFPVSVGSVDRNSLADNGAISFWADEIFYFDPSDSSFTQLTNQGAVPFPGHQSEINGRHRVVFEAGGDIWLATPTESTPVPVADVPFQLAQNFPNPFNPQTTIAFDLKVPAVTSLRILDVAGRRVQVLLSGENLPSGSHETVWDGRDGRGRSAASGTYFYELRAGDFFERKRMTLLK